MFIFTTGRCIIKQYRSTGRNVVWKKGVASFVCRLCLILGHKVSIFVLLHQTQQFCGRSGKTQLKSTLHVNIQLPSTEHKQHQHQAKRRNVTRWWDLTNEENVPLCAEARTLARSSVPTNLDSWADRFILSSFVVQKCNAPGITKLIIQLMTS